MIGVFETKGEISIYQSFWLYNMGKKQVIGVFVTVFIHGLNRGFGYKT